MRNSITFTSTLSKDLVSLLDDYSKKMNTTKSKMINIAISNYINQLKKEKYINSFKRAKDDIEIKNLTEAGIEDFLQIIDNKKGYLIKSVKLLMNN